MSIRARTGSKHLNLRPISASFEKNPSVSTTLKGGDSQLGFSAYEEINDFL